MRGVTDSNNSHFVTSFFHEPNFMYLPVEILPYLFRCQTTDPRLGEISRFTFEHPGIFQMSKCNASRPTVGTGTIWYSCKSRLWDEGHEKHGDQQA
jgi:hypothetical protein